LYADSIIGFAVNRAANLLSQRSSAPVYYYEFTYQGRYSHFYLPDSNETVPYGKIHSKNRTFVENHLAGVVHHDDLIYLFYVSAIFPYFDDSYPEAEMVTTLTSLWATFAQTGYIKWK
jgi:carboxylesterase type B